MENRPLIRKKVAIVSIALGLLTLLLTPWIVQYVRHERQMVRRSTCHSNLRAIGIALNTYHFVYGCFPPAYTTDAAGNGMHSWRVLVLPYLEEDAVYANYNFKEPWNSPGNLRLATSIPEVYRCPEEPDGRSTDTSYLAIVGPHAAWRGSTSVRPSDVKNSRAIIVAEVADSGITWTEPRDLDFEQAAAGVNCGHRPGISSRHPGSASCLSVDGSVHDLRDGIAPRLLNELLRIDVRDKQGDLWESTDGPWDRR